MSFLVLLATALALGVRHALDPDHLVAVSTLAAEERRLWPAARLGLIWGVGHLLPIALVGLPVLLLQLQLPPNLEGVVDLAVGFLLILLGVHTLWQLFRKRVHSHAHPHGSHTHAHFHAHAASPAGVHRHHADAPGQGRSRRPLITFALGMVHGLAGSAPAAVLALSATATVAGGVGFLLTFGFGTMLGMFITTLCVAAPAVTLISRSVRLHSIVQGAAGLASVAVGVTMWLELLPH